MSDIFAKPPKVADILPGWRVDPPPKAIISVAALDDYPAQAGRAREEACRQNESRLFPMA
jgi:hypothetical protein